MTVTVPGAWQRISAIMLVGLAQVAHAQAPASAPAPVPAPVPAPAPGEDVSRNATLEVTADGSRIFVQYTVSQAAMGPVGTAYEVWNRHGERLRSETAYAIEQPGRPPADADEAAARAKAAAQDKVIAQLLDELTRQGLQPPVPELAAEEPARNRLRDVAPGTNKPRLTIELSEAGRLSLTPAGHAAVVRRNPAWRSKPTAAEEAELAKWREDGRIRCYNPAQLRSASVDLPHRVALVVIGYRGNDNCWEPNDDHVVITW